ncbi:hypothetical protein [Roseibium sediminis]|uniref:hypothetical protein n=1 Tax=Roseibium sediminis TaxID=1775174 RepID=UPI00123CFBF9|nr:hypothetical protein [Roseibium sediminis]
MEELVGQAGQLFCNFMIENNGVSPAAYRCDAINISGRRFPLQTLKRVSGMLKHRETEMEYLPPYQNYLCFALGPSSHEEFLYCIVGPDKGSVWVLYRDQDFQVGTNFFPEGDYMIKVSEDFESFLGALEVEPEEE